MIFFLQDHLNPEKFRRDVRILYEKYHDLFSIQLRSENDTNGERKYYVYEWFTKDEKKIFYIGKGTDKRYNHILTDIKDGYKSHHRGDYYKELQDNFGIDYRIVADKLTSLEAEVYETCWINERYSEGEVLLQFTDMPSAFYQARRDEDDTLLSRKFYPKIAVSDYRKRYFNIKEDIFNYDAISLPLLLNTHLLYSYSRLECVIENEKDIIRNFIKNNNGRIFTTLAKGVKSLIEFGNIDYDKYKLLKEEGYQIFHSFHVLEFIRTCQIDK